MLSRIALVAAITFSLALAVVGGVLFGEAVISPPEPAPEQPQEPARASRAEQPQEERGPKPEVWPARGAEDAAREIAESRAGVISFAAIGPGGETVEFDPHRQYYSASVSKSMLLVAELWRLRREDLPLDETTRGLLEQMITISDNDAADAIYARVGDPGLNEVAAAAGMTHFSGDVGHWSNAKVTAGDMALFMSKLDQLLDLPNGDAGAEMLASVISSQRWGIPEAAPDGARVSLKGGWRPSGAGQLVHQAARVDFHGESYFIAVLTDGNPDQTYGEETIRMIASKLIGMPTQARPYRG